MIAVAVAALLAGLALPNFTDAVRKSRRADAYAALAALQQAQERWRADHASYTATLADLGLPATTPSGYYAITVAPPSAAPQALNTGYIATAVGIDGSLQAGDTQCRRLSVRLQAGQLSYAGCGHCAAFSYAARDPCWTH